VRSGSRELDLDSVKSLTFHRDRGRSLFRLNRGGPHRLDLEF